MTTRFTQDVRPITDLKTHAAEIVDHASQSRRPVLLTRHGRGVAVLLDVAEYDALMDRTEFVMAIREGEEASRAGDVVPHGEAVRILETFGT